MRLHCENAASLNVKVEDRDDNLIETDLCTDRDTIDDHFHLVIE